MTNRNRTRVHNRPKPQMPYEALAPETQYRYGDRAEIPRQAHSRETLAYRRGLMLAMFRPVEGRLIADLSSGVPLRDAAETAGVSVAAIHARRHWDELWANRVDTALTTGRDPSLNHGTAHTYRKFRCRCPECRAAHDQTRGTKRRKLV